MAQPLQIPSSKAQISSAENKLAEEILSSLLQIMSRGTTGSDPVSPTVIADERDANARKPYLLSTTEQQLGMRHLSLALAKNLVAQKDVSETTAPGKIPRAKEDGKIDASFVPEGTFATRKYVDDKIASVDVPAASSDIQASAQTGLAPLDASGKIPVEYLPALSYSQDSEVVHKTADETIAGVKSFSSLPIVVGSPRISTHAVNKAYVDSLAAVVFSFGASTVSTAAATYFLFPWYENTTAPTTEAKIRTPLSGFIREFYFQSRGAGAVTGGTMTFTLRVNGVDVGSALVVTTATQSLVTFASPVRVEAGDTLSLKLVVATTVNTAPTDIVVSFIVKQS